MSDEPTGEAVARIMAVRRTMGNRGRYWILSAPFGGVINGEHTWITDRGLFSPPMRGVDMGTGKAGRVALVTGAAAGIGAAYAQRLAADGARLVVVDRDAPTATVAAIVDAGGEAVAVTIDVTDPVQVERCHVEASAVFGAVDILVNNVGIYPRTPWDTLDLDELHRVLRVNLDSAFLMCKQFLPDMRQRGWGRIVNITSRTVWLPVPDHAAYLAAKAAVIGLTRALATEVGQDGVTVNVVAPGLTDTATMRQGTPDMVFDATRMQQAIKRTQQPDDLVGVVSFLASDDAAFMTGQTLMVDGGMTRL